LATQFRPPITSATYYFGHQVAKVPGGRNWRELWPPITLATQIAKIPTEL
jgi:hypothetical protein